LIIKLENKLNEVQGRT